MKNLIKESGIRNIKDLANRYPKAKIYFHQDLDGVTTAIAMKNYLENNGIKVVDVEIIQYGDKEFSIKKTEASGDIMPVLVDFAHGKPMFVIHTDHHDSQKGVEKDTSVSFRPSRSNVATISQIVSPKELFPYDDISLISTVDSADFARFNLSPDDIMNFIFKLSKDEGLQKNKMVLGFVTNKLLLAYKNKPGFLESLVMESSPSLLNIFQNIIRIAKKNNYASPEEMASNQEKYIKSQKESPKVQNIDGIIVQYGGGSMFKPGSYDRYTPFKNNPEADFLVIAWPMGLVQASCNPFKKERELKGVNLGEISQEVLSKWEGQLKEKIIPLSTIKWVSETGIKEGSVGFTKKDLDAFYGDKLKSIEGGERYLDRLKEIMDKPYSSLDDSEWNILDNIGVPAWDIIQANSGGHKCITNISALNYFGRGKRPPSGQYRYDSEREDSPMVKFVKMIQNRFVEVLKQKIDESKQIKESASKLRSNLPVGVVEKGREIDSGGEISTELADIAIELFNELTSKGIKGIRITSGNDSYHQKITSYRSKHADGKALDFTVPNYSSQRGTVIEVLNNLKSKYPQLNYIDEYANPSGKSTGGHFHLQLGGKSTNYSKNYSSDNVSNPITTSDNTKSGEILTRVGSLMNKAATMGLKEEKAELVEPNREDFFKELEDFDGLITQSDQKNIEYTKIVETFQIALELLGYRLPTFGVDGKFGKETASALNKFKKDNNIEVGEDKAVFDEETSKKMVIALEDKGISDEDISNYVLPRKEFTSVDGTIKHNYTGEKARNIELLIDTMNEMGIDDAASQVGILSVIGKESGFLLQKETGYQNTSNSRIRSIFSKTSNLSDSELDSLKSDYDKFFNFVYGGILGNDTKNDGSKYVGRGFNGITGKVNYRKYGEKVGMDLVSNPELLLDPKLSAKAAILFLTKGEKKDFKDAYDASLHYTDVNAGGRVSRWNRENSLKVLDNFDIV
jgi:putative chitinase